MAFTRRRKTCRDGMCDLTVLAAPHMCAGERFFPGAATAQYILIVIFPTPPQGDRAAPGQALVLPLRGQGA